VVVVRVHKQDDGPENVRGKRAEEQSREDQRPDRQDNLRLRKSAGLRYGWILWSIRHGCTIAKRGTFGDLKRRTQGHALAGMTHGELRPPLERRSSISPCSTVKCVVADEETGRIPATI